MLRLPVTNKMSKQLEKKISDQQKVIDELLVVIDTAQSAIRRAESTIKDEGDFKYVINQSAKWVLSFKYNSNELDDQEMQIRAQTI